MRSPTPLRAALETGEGPTIVCAQAGEVNTGAFDDFHAICGSLRGARRLAARRRRLRAVGRGEPALSPSHRRRRASRLLGDGRPQVAQRPLRLRHRVLRPSRRARVRRWSATASYLLQVDEAEAREPMAYTPEFSRRARSVPVYAAIRAARPLAASPSSSSAAATRRLRSPRASRAIPGCTVLNEVVLNQVLVRFDDRRAHDGERSQRSRRTARHGRAATVWEGRAGDPVLGLELAHDARRRRAQRRRVRARRRVLTSTSPRPRLRGALRQLVHDSRVGERRRVAERPVLGHIAEQAAHDLPRAGLRQLGREDDVRRLRDRADLVATWLRSSSSISTEPGSDALQRHVGDDRLTRRRVGAAADRGLGHLRVVDERRLDLDRRDAVP